VYVEDKRVYRNMYLQVMRRVFDWLMVATPDGIVVTKQSVGKWAPMFSSTLQRPALPVTSINL